MYEPTFSSEPKKTRTSVGADRLIMTLVYSLPLLYWTNIEYCMGMVAGSMGTLRPLFIKIAGLTSRISNSSKSTSDQTDGPPYNNMFTSKRRKRGAASRVQGDSILHTGVSMTTPTVATNTTRAGRAGDEEERGGGDIALHPLFEGPIHSLEKQCCCPGAACNIEISQCEITTSSNSH